MFRCPRCVKQGKRPPLQSPGNGLYRVDFGMVPGTQVKRCRWVCVECYRDLTEDKQGSRVSE